MLASIIVVVLAIPVLAVIRIVMAMARATGLVLSAAPVPADPRLRR